MDKDIVVYIHSGILSAVKRCAFESVLMRWMNIEPIIQSEVSQNEKDKYCENDYTSKHNLQIQCDPYQMTFFTELEQKISQFIWKQQRP